jgi:[NiFe] hydrogenase diaphorase moiety small subunit
MSESLTFVLDGAQVTARPGQSILEAADDAGAWIPRLCHWPGLEPLGGCRVCSVQADGRMVAACTQPVRSGMVVHSDGEAVREQRRILIELLLVEGNHFCMVCERSGACELQALAYRLGVTAPRFEHRYPVRQVDASHPDVLIDRDRCVLCGRCVRASQQLDGKHVFGFAGRGPRRRVVVSSGQGLGGTAAQATDQAIEACPVGALLRKRQGYAVPVGARPYDHHPIGTPSAERPRQEPRP